MHDKTKEPMSAAMWSKARPVMHAIADVSDGWERFGNALSPTAPFPKEKPRMKLAAVCPNSRFQRQFDIEHSLMTYRFLYRFFSSHCLQTPTCS